MSIANSLVLPNPLSNGTTADAVPVMGDFNYLLTALNRALLDQGGTSGMNAQSTQIHNLANGTAGNDAVNLSQLQSYLPLGGGTLTGGLSGTTLALSSTLGVSGASTLAALTASGLITGNAGFSGTTLSLSGAASIAALTASGLITGNAGFSGTTLSLSGNLTTAWQQQIQFTDANGTKPYFEVQNDGNFVFYSTDATGAPRGVLSILTRSSTSGLGINPPLTLSSTLGVSGASTLAALTASGLITGNAGFSGTTLSLSGAASLNGGGTSTTPSYGDSSTKIATTAFVQAAKAPNVQSVTSAATVAPTFSNDLVDITAQAAALTLANPTGTAVNGWGWLIRIVDNGVSQAITYGAQYVGIGFTLPTATVAGKALELGCVWNANKTRVEVVSMAQE